MSAASSDFEFMHAILQRHADTVTALAVCYVCRGSGCPACNVKGYIVTERDSSGLTTSQSNEAAS